MKENHPKRRVGIIESDTSSDVVNAYELMATTQDETIRPKPKTIPPKSSVNVRSAVKIKKSLKSRIEEISLD